MHREISIIIPCAPGKYPDLVLHSLQQLNYPKDKMQVIVVEGKQPARQRNEAIKRATGEIVFFFDDDVTVEKDIVNKMLEHYYNGSVAVVGGPNLTPETDSHLQKCFGYIMASSLASYKMGTRYKQSGESREADEKELILCNLSSRRSVLDKEGAFVENLWPNEENELFNRLHGRGYSLIYDPDAVVYHSRRPSVASFVKQLFGYGRGRAEQTLIQPSSLRPVFLIPSVFLLYLISIPLVILLLHLSLRLSLIYSAPLFFYIACCLIGALKIAYQERDARSVLYLPWMFAMTHLPYGSGFLYGVLKQAHRKRGRIQSPVNISFVSVDNL